MANVREIFQPKASHRAILLASALAGSACIPNHRPEALSPPLLGSIRNSDNSPAAAMLVAVVEYDWHGPCRKVTRWVTTGPTGAFEVPASYIVRRWIMLFPPIERFDNSYQVCVGQDSASLTVAYTGRVWLRGGPADTVRCVMWSSRGRSWPSCAGHNQKLVQADGAWTTPTASGFYRLLVPAEDSGAEEAMVQWVQRLDGGGERVVDSLPLPIARHIVDISKAELHTRAEGTCVTVTSLGRKEHWYSLDLSRVESTLELGPPGQAAPSKSCTSASLARTR
jgi:hypothetical protein